MHRPDGRLALRHMLLAFAVLLLAAGSVPRLAAAENTAPPAPQYAGAETCLACHDQVPGLQKQDWHSQALLRRPGARNCEDCHGASAAHTEDPTTVSTALKVTKAPASQSAKACLSCHTTSTNNLTLWRSTDHARGNVACWDCHSQGGTPHSKMLRKPDQSVCFSCHREQQPTFQFTSHHPVREGRMDCSDCHKPHARQSPRDWEQVCASCHLQQRGPFVFPHGAMSGQLGEGCLDCHQPHGSPNTRLLRYNGRGVCLQCHADHALHFVGRTCWTSGCHSQLHGSNTSPLLLGR